MYALPGKLLMGTSGFVVDAIGYPWFFVYTSSLGMPGAGDAVLPDAAGATGGQDGRHWPGGTSENVPYFFSTARAALRPLAPLMPPPPCTPLPHRYRPSIGVR